MAEDGKIIYKVKIDDSGAVDEAERAGRRAGEAAERSAQKSSSFIQEVMTGAARRIGEAFVNMAVRAGEGLKQIVSNGIDFNAQMEQYQTAFTTLLGDAEAAADAMAKIREDAARTPFNVESLTAANQALISAGLSADKAREDVNNLANAIAATGGGSAELSRMAANMQQIQNTGKATAMDIRQFANAGINIYGLLADSMGITAKEAAELDVTYDQLAEALAHAAEEGGMYAGAMEAQSQTFTGRISTLKDNVAQLEGTLTADLFAQLSDTALPMVQDWVATLLEAAETDGIAGAIQAGTDILGEIINVLVSGAPGLIEAGVPVIMSLLQGLIENLPLVLDAGIQIIFAIVDGLTQALPELIPAIVDVILTIVEKLTDPDTVVQLIQAAFQIILAIAEGLIRAVPKLVEKVPEIVRNLLEGFVRQWPEFVKGGSDLLDKLGDGIMAALGGLVRIVDNVITSIWEQISGLINDALSWGSDLIGNFISGIWSRAQELWNTIASIAGSVRDYLGFSEPKLGPLSNFHTYAPDMIDLFAQGLKDNEIVLTRTIKDVFDLEPAIDSAMPDLNTYAMAMPALASGMLERSASEAISYNNSSVGGATYYIYNTIDAKNVKDFNSVVDLLSSAETIRRMQ